MPPVLAPQKQGKTERLNLAIQADPHPPAALLHRQADIRLRSQAHFTLAEPRDCRHPFEGFSAEYLYAAAERPLLPATTTPSSNASSALGTRYERPSRRSGTG